MNHPKVKAELTEVSYPTYPVGLPERNPMFFEKRVYQGSSGKVYPVPFIDRISDEARPQVYQAARIENEFVRLLLLPEIGGRIHVAQDKTANDYDIFYRQDTIKPALVGLAGPWVSGGVEFNWPQHHRPGTFLPTDPWIEEEPSGALTIWLSEHDPLKRLKGMHGVRLRPGSALIELRARLFCLASRDFDLSVGSTVAFAGVSCAMLLNATDNLLVSVVVTLLGGALIGWVNGAVIAYLRINALITTLATMQIVRGLGFIASHGQAIGVSNVDFILLADSSLFGISLPIWTTLICFLVFGGLLNKTVFGRNTLAIGGNPEASRLAGINVERTRVLIFLIQGIVAALAGIILASRITSGQPNAAQGFELNVISACVLGGVSLMGGRATISGVIVGVLILGTAENVMNLLNIDAFYQYLVRGAILLAAVLVDRQRTRGIRD
jgi:L-arabinose transport system permease protein